MVFLRLVVLIMLAAILGAAAVICAVNWVNQVIVTWILQWYMFDKKNLPPPSDEELEEGKRWVSDNFDKIILNSLRICPKKRI